MTQYTFAVKINLETEMRSDILEYLISNSLKELNVNVFSGKEENPVSVEVKSKKS